MKLGTSRDVARDVTRWSLHFAPRDVVERQESRSLRVFPLSPGECRETSVAAREFVMRNQVSSDRVSVLINALIDLRDPGKRRRFVADGRLRKDLRDSCVIHTL